MAKSKQVPKRRSAKDHEIRKRHFRAACVYFGLTRETWARKHKVATSYLDCVRHGIQASPRVDALIDDTIREFHKAAAEYYAAHGAA